MTQDPEPPGGTPQDPVPGPPPISPPISPSDPAARPAVGTDSRAALAMVLGIVGILFGLCCAPLGLIAGGYGVYLAGQAEKVAQAQGAAGDAGNARAARIASIIAVTVSGLATLALLTGNWGGVGIG